MAYDVDNARTILCVRCPRAGENLPPPGIGTVTIEINTVLSSNVIFAVKVTHHLALIVITNTHIGIHS